MYFSYIGNNYWYIYYKDLFIFSYLRENDNKLKMGGLWQ